MTKTTNYQLPKWEKTDRVQMLSLIHISEPTIRLPNSYCGMW